jgi:hypothetical protein
MRERSPLERVSYELTMSNGYDTYTTVLRGSVLTNGLLFGLCLIEIASLEQFSQTLPVSQFGRRVNDLLLA